MRVGAGGDGGGLAVGLGAEGGGACVGDPDLDRAEALGAEAVAVFADLLAGGLWGGGGGHRKGSGVGYM